MRREDVRFAAAARDDGLRKVSKYTWRAGAARVVCSALLAVAFGHHVATQQPAAAHNSGGSGAAGASNTGSGAAGSSNGNGGSSVGGGSSNGGSGSQGQGTIVVPAQPPAPASGGGQVISGAS